MTEIEIRKITQGELSEIVKQELNNIAPEVDLANIDPAADLRENVDIDSIDFLNLVTALHHRTGIDIPEIDYPKLVTLSGMIAYLRAKLESAKE
ncbi:acyl carrier protein [Bradyrhizobium sp. HKCCYLRH2060]|uniref:acyl carrier protein n=1 Tax=Bradyrhizobium TaxID=374 RepID=UPI002916F672|nr:acyl carrier protein [Bradyrhizobium sp. SZCCHNR3003]